MDLKAIKSASLEELQHWQSLIGAELSARKKPPLIKSDQPGVVVYTDGASRGNPGHAGIGVLVYDLQDRKLLEDCRYLGISTNNEAEYQALLLALDHAQKLTRGELRCVMDSELVVRQMTGRYAVKAEKMKELHAQVREKLKQFSSFSFTHVPREHPKLQMADKLANLGIDNHFKSPQGA